MAKTATPERAAATSSAPLPVAPSKVRTLNLLTPTFGVSDGYGNSAEQMAIALERAGLNVTISGTARQAGFLNAPEIHDRQHVMGEAIVFYSQPQLWSAQHSGSRRPIGFTMYESDEIPAEWIPRLIVADEIWVPSTWNVDVIGRHTKRPVYHVPLGVDAKAFFPTKRVRGEKLRILFFSTYASEVRKGLDLAREAFSAAFPGREDVEFVVRSSFPCDVRAQLGDEFDVRSCSQPRSRMDVGQLTTASLAAYYRTFDALLYPSRGEGFGLIPLEVMATGMPAIFTAATGMYDYADLGMPVEARSVPALVGSGRGGDAQQPRGRWFEPSLEQLVDRLRQLDTDYDAVQAQAMRDAAKIAKVWTWDRTAQTIIGRLEA